jgi:hypothetical protein
MQRLVAKPGRNGKRVALSFLEAVVYLCLGPADAECHTTLPKKEAVEAKRIGLQEFQIKTKSMAEQFIELQHDTDKMLEWVPRARHLPHLEVLRGTQGYSGVLRTAAFRIMPCSEGRSRRCKCSNEGRCHRSGASRIERAE